MTLDDGTERPVEQFDGMTVRSTKVLPDGLVLAVLGRDKFAPGTAVRMSQEDYRKVRIALTGQ